MFVRSRVIFVFSYSYSILCNTMLQYKLSGDLNRYPMAQITRVTTQIGVKPAPVMAAFSSKGPNTLTPEIFKVVIPCIAFFLVITQSITVSLFSK